MKIARNFTSSCSGPFALARRCLPALATSGTLLLASCTINTTMVVDRGPVTPPEVPSAAYIVGGGLLAVSYTAPAAGSLFVVEGNYGMLLVTKSMSAGEKFELDATDPNILKAIREARRARCVAIEGKPDTDVEVCDSDEYHPRLVLHFLPD